MRKEPRADKTDSVLDLPFPASKRCSSSEIQGLRWEKQPGKPGELVPDPSSGVSSDWCPDLDEKIRARRKQFQDRMGFTLDGDNAGRLEERILRDTFGDMTGVFSNAHQVIALGMGVGFLIGIGLFGAVIYVLR